MTQQAVCGIIKQIDFKAGIGMDYTTLKEYIKSLTGRGIVPGLDTIKSLLTELGNPQNSLRVIHVAGTNGKGSFGAYLSSIIESSSIQCGRFVSPCVGEYKNTFLINGNCVSEEIVTDCADTLKSAIETLEKRGIFPTSFEAETALAFIVFNRISPDYVIIECGMGGLMDATNVTDNPELSVITKISLDHTAFLGNTIEEIAFQKAGIIKSGRPVVCADGQNDAIKVIERICKEKGSEMFIADVPQITELGSFETCFNINNNTYTTKMLGTYQPHNAALAIKAAQVLGITDGAIKNGIRNAQWAYRFERIGKFILDGAHNPDGASALAKSLKAYTSPENTVFICACFKDKDFDKIAELTSPYASRVYCITAPTPRGLDSEVLCDAFKKHGLDATTSPTLKSAIDSALEFKNIVIFGTLSILSEAKEIIERLQDNATL